MLLSALLAAAFATVSSTDAPFEIRGRIERIARNSVEQGVLMRVAGANVQVTGSTRITSPTATLTIDQLADMTPLPGREQPGFTGGRATVLATWNAKGGVVLAEQIHVEPEETILSGPVTSNGEEGLRIAGTAVVLLNDARVRAEVVKDRFGFAVALASVAAGDLTSAEGYLGADGRLYAWQIETTGGQPAAAPESSLLVSIQRADCRDQPGAGTDEMEVSGAVVLDSSNDPGVVEIWSSGGPKSRGQLMGLATPEASEDVPGLATYRFRATDLTLPGGRCRPSIRAEYKAAGKNASAMAATRVLE